jgi:hypothetical protein
MSGSTADISAKYHNKSLSLKLSSETLRTVYESFPWVNDIVKFLIKSLGDFLLFVTKN